MNSTLRLAHTRRCSNNALEHCNEETEPKHQEVRTDTRNTATNEAEQFLLQMSWSKQHAIQPTTTK